MEVLAATPKISELWLIPVLEAMLDQFPFRIRGFYSDNGSEYVNCEVSRLLGKLLIEQTKSRARHSMEKLRCSFSPLPPPLEIATRFPHSHSFDFGTYTQASRNGKEPSGLLFFRLIFR